MSPLARVVLAGINGYGREYLRCLLDDSARASPIYIDAASSGAFAAILRHSSVATFRLLLLRSSSGDEIAPNPLHHYISETL